MPKKPNFSDVARITKLFCVVDTDPNRAVEALKDDFRKWLTARRQEGFDGFVSASNFNVTAYTSGFLFWKKITWVFDLRVDEIHTEL